MNTRPIRIRDFIRDADNWLYAIAAYDTIGGAGCVLRYIPDPSGERVDPKGIRYRKVDFGEAYALIAAKKPSYSGLVHRVPLSDIVEILKPDEHLARLAAEDERVQRLKEIFALPDGSFGVTGSMLCGIAGSGSDIDCVVYGSNFAHAQQKLRQGIESGLIEDLDERLWKSVYKKRNPDLGYEEFLLHEQRKWNRGQIDGTYFDLLYSRSYDDLPGFVMKKGTVIGRDTIQATVSGDQFSFDSPAIYEIDHPKIRRVLSFTHTYTGQAIKGERIEAQGIVEQHGNEQWLIVGTTREAKGEFIRSLTLLEKNT
ncbi:MAG TPA: nucleotidyltransferase domain-containing protein [Methanospirillum sp.]|uniref:nucleotidyltransferase domain-containing protein n=1 Tax=Methanospirillum sp. TaxID=45200 RepID=UPI002CCC133B|nr:nucleotidyltransferase domain-containing protein [Methanospirillum sp.]HWQ64998.1 nucleotidyltransferase domain-containing protein [Methanospirillum sp.]